MQKFTQHRLVNNQQSQNSSIFRPGFQVIFVIARNSQYNQKLCITNRQPDSCLYIANICEGILKICRHPTSTPTMYVVPIQTADGSTSRVTEVSGWKLKDMQALNNSITLFPAKSSTSRNEQTLIHVLYSQCIYIGHRMKNHRARCTIFLRYDVTSFREGDLFLMKS